MGGGGGGGRRSVGLGVTLRWGKEEEEKGGLKGRGKRERERDVVRRTRHDASSLALPSSSPVCACVCRGACCSRICRKGLLLSMEGGAQGSIAGAE